MNSQQIQQAVEGVMRLRPATPGKQKESCMLEIDHLRDELLFNPDEYELKGVNLTTTDYRYVSAKQVEAARETNPRIFYSDNN
jgi:hypothetical protein